MGIATVFKDSNSIFGAMTENIEQIIKEAKKVFENAEGGHDWFHVERVMKNALKIGEYEGGNKEILLLGSILHDIADAKFHNGDMHIGSIKAKELLDKHNIESDIAEKVLDIVTRISYKGGYDDRKEKSLELQIVQDADRLDAIGAIGIARTFNYGGYANRKLYDPQIQPATYNNAKEYYKSTSPTINHFYEKLLLLKDKMNTETGKKWAERRHKIMETYLRNFLMEWEGKDFHPDSNSD